MCPLCLSFGTYCPKNGVGLAQLLDQPCPSSEVYCTSFGTDLIEYQKKITGGNNLVCGIIINQLYNQLIIIYLDKLVVVKSFHFHYSIIGFVKYPMMTGS